MMPRHRSGCAITSNIAPRSPTSASCSKPAASKSRASSNANPSCASRTAPRSSTTTSSSSASSTRGRKSSPATSAKSSRDFATRSTTGRAAADDPDGVHRSDGGVDAAGRRSVSLPMPEYCDANELDELRRKLLWRGPAARRRSLPQRLHGSEQQVQPALPDVRLQRSARGRAARNTTCRAGPTTGSPTSFFRARITSASRS